MAASLNLIPDIKREYLRTQIIKKLAIVACVGISLVSLIILLILGVILLTQTSIKSALAAEIDSNYNSIIEEKDSDNVSSISRLLTIQSDVRGINDAFNKLPVTSRLIDFLNDTNLPAPNDVTIERIVFTGGETAGSAFTVSVTGSIASYAALDTYKLSLQNAKFCSEQDREQHEVKTCYELEEKLKKTGKELPPLFAMDGVKQKSSSYSLQRDRVSFRLDLTFNSGADHPFAYFTRDKDGKIVRMTGVKAIVESKRANDSSVNTPLFEKTANNEDDTILEEGSAGEGNG